MALKTLDQLRNLKEALTRIHKAWLRWRYAIEIPTTVKLSLSAKLRAEGIETITIGEDTLIAFKTLIYTSDKADLTRGSVHIGSRCFIGGGSTIRPGVSIGDECIVGAGSVVYDDVPSHTIVGGNPARVLRKDVSLGRYGVMPVAHDNTKRLWTL